MIKLKVAIEFNNGEYNVYRNVEAIEYEKDWVVIKFSATHEKRIPNRWVKEVTTEVIL